MYIYSSLVLLLLLLLLLSTIIYTHNKTEDYPYLQSLLACKQLKMA